MNKLPFYHTGLRTFRLILFLALPFYARCQNKLEIDTVKFDFSEVVMADSLGVKTLYSNAKLFIAQAFVSAKNVTQLEDENTHTIVVKGLLVLGLKDLPFSFSYMHELTTTFTLQLQIKDGRYKYTLNNFIVQGNEVYDKSNLSLPYIRQKGEVGEKAHKKLWDNLKATGYNWVANFIPLMKNKMITVDTF